MEFSNVATQGAGDGFGVELNVVWRVRLDEVTGEAAKGAVLEGSIVLEAADVDETGKDTGPDVDTVVGADEDPVDTVLADDTVEMVGNVGVLDDDGTVDEGCADLSEDERCVEVSGVDA